MSDSILTHCDGAIGVVTLNRPRVLNAWDASMRDKLIESLQQFDADTSIRSIVLTGAGDRAFGAGQDLNEAKEFDPDRAERWIAEWERLYECIRGLSKPLIAALNGVAAGSAFQVALLCDIRIGHGKVTMGQPEINSGIPSTTGPWIMREHLGLARTIELTLTGRMMPAEECHQIGIINELVPSNDVMQRSLEIAGELADKPPVAMRLNKRRFAAITEPGFRDCLAAGVEHQREAYASGEPQRMMEIFLSSRSSKS